MSGVRTLRCGRLVFAATLAVMASGMTIGVVAAPMAGGTTSAPIACALLAPQDLHSVLRGRVDQGSPTSSPDGSETICEWVVYPNAKHGYGAELHVYAGRRAKDFDLQRRSASAPTRTVKHVADAAFSERAVLFRQVYDDLWVRKGTTIFRLETLRDLGTKPLIKLARIVVKNLAPASA